jgi:hypothetical protein
MLSLRDETSRGEYTTLETLNNVTLDDVKGITQPISHRKTPI